MEVKRESAVRSMVRGDLAIDEYNPYKSLDCPRRSQSPQHRGLIRAMFCSCSSSFVAPRAKSSMSKQNMESRCTPSSKMTA